MIQNIVAVLTDVGTIMAILLLLRYVFGASLALNLKKMLYISLIYFVYGMACYLLLGNAGAFVGLILFLIAVFMITCKEKRWMIFLYLIPVLLLYIQFAHYMQMYDRLFGRDDEIFFKYADLLLLAVLLAWAAYAERKQIFFTLNFGECFFVAFWGLVSCFYGDVMDMIESNTHPGRNEIVMKGAWIFFVTVLNGCLVMTIVFRRKHARQREISRCYQQYFEQEYQAFRKKNDRQQELDRLRHDWKNHVNTVQAMWEKGEEEKAVQYVAGLAEESKPDVYAILSGNEVADAILNLKYEKAKEAGIHFIFQGDLSGLARIDSMDICVLLGNALDNALEACGKEEQDGSILIKTSESEGFLLITIENTLHEAIVLRNNRPVTSKKHPSEHGFGVLGMEHVIHKYQGDLRFTVTEELFRVQMMLPVAGNKGGKPAE